MPQDTACARVQVSQALTFFGIFEDPVDSGEVIIAYSSPRPLDIPVQPVGIFGVLELFTGVAWCVEVIQDKLRRAIRTVRWWGRRRAIAGRGERRGEESREARGRSLCFVLALEG